MKEFELHPIGRDSLTLLSLWVVLVNRADSQVSLSDLLRSVPMEVSKNGNIKKQLGGYDSIPEEMAVAWTMLVA